MNLIERWRKEKYPNIEMMKEKGFMINYKTFKKGENWGVLSDHIMLKILLQVVHAVDRKRPSANHLYPVYFCFILII